MYRYKNIALASTFSPRFLPLLSEIKRIAEKLGIGFSLIHAGEENPESVEKFRVAFEEMGLAQPPKIHWATGETPTEAILNTIREQGIDLLVAGALEKEISGRQYVGNVARSLLRDAPCSLLLFVRPSTEPQAFRQIVSVIDYSEVSKASLQQTYFLAEQNAGEVVRVARIFTIFTQALGQPKEFFEKESNHQSMLQAEEQRIEKFARAAGECAVPVETACIEGTTGFAASDYVQAVEADLLVIPSKPPGTQRLLPDGMDWVFNVIPSNLLIVRANGE